MGLHQSNDPVGECPDRWAVALLVVEDQPLVRRQIGNRPPDAGKTRIGITDKARQDGETRPGRHQFAHRMGIIAADDYAVPMMGFEPAGRGR